MADEQTAFTGGVGIAEERCGNARKPAEWRDTHVRVRGPAVDGIGAAFAQNWAECHDELFDDRDRFTEHPQTGSSVVQVVRGSASEEFARLWDQHEVAVRRASTKRFRHPAIGILDLDCEVLVNSDHDQRLVIHTARPGTESYERLQLLRVVGLQDLTPTGS
ncbi:hypothetical protein SRO_0289 [Streptomyces rochei]|nr:hypothetical protein SRO_0289 [Streptomyces rochei]